MDLTQLLSGQTLPARSSLIAFAQFVEMTAASPHLLGEIIELGWIEPVRTGQDEYLFAVGDAWRVGRLARICRDFEVTALPGSIIVDLLARIEELERQVDSLRRLL